MFTLRCRQANIVATVLLPLSTTPVIIVAIVIDTGDKLCYVINYVYRQCHGSMKILEMVLSLVSKAIAII